MFRQHQGAICLKIPEVLPTGRNIHGFDPFRIPSKFACIQGRVQADQLARAPHVPMAANCPRAFAMVLWGTDNLKSEGAQDCPSAWPLLGARNHALTIMVGSPEPS